MAIAMVSGLIALWALVVMVAISPVVGGVALVVAAGVALLDATYGTPVHIDVADGRVTFAFWRRTKAYDANALVVTHDVPRDRFTVHRRGRRRPLARFRDDGTAVGAFVDAGTEIISR